MALLDDMKVAVRVSSDAYNSEIRMWIDAALADMRRVGVNPDMLTVESPSALVLAAITCFVKAKFGYDVDERRRFDESYRSLVISLMNSSANIGYEADSDD